MKDWVIPLRKLIRPPTVSEEAWEQDEKVPSFIHRDIANLFLHQFESDQMVELLGSVVCDLSRENFDRLFEINPFFILAKSPGFCQRMHSAKEELTLVIFVQSGMVGMNWLQLRGLVIHEICHVLRGDLSKPFSLEDPHRHKLEEECDAMCCELGFPEEIIAVRKFLERRKANGNV